VREVKYKPSLYFPILTSGWSELQEYHNIPDNAEVVFGYNGKSIFAITTIREIDDP